MNKELIFILQQIDRQFLDYYLCDAIARKHRDGFDAACPDIQCVNCLVRSSECKQISDYPNRVLKVGDIL